MGYITTYSLCQVKNYSEDAEDYICSQEPFSLVLEEGCKWYEHETDMLELSKKFKHVVFRLGGEGEEAGDIWVKYFHGGVLIFQDKLEVKLKVPDLSRIEEFNQRSLKEILTEYNLLDSVWKGVALGDLAPEIDKKMNSLIEEAKSAGYSMQGFR